MNNSTQVANQVKVLVHYGYILFEVFINQYKWWWWLHSTEHDIFVILVVWQFIIITYNEI